MTAFFYRSLYLPHKGMFSELPADLSLGHIQVISHLLSFAILSQQLSECQAKTQTVLGIRLLSGQIQGVANVRSLLQKPHRYL